MQRSIDLQGHRGARGLAPENTLPGFAAALAIGVDTLELDVAVTADGVVVVTHDPALNPDITRGADGAWLAGRGRLIHSLRAADLEGYDVGRIRPGSDYAARYPEQVAHDGARIPTFAEVLRIDKRVKFNVELKLFPAQPDWTVAPEAMVDAVLAECDAAAATPRVTLQSFDWRAPRYLRRIRPEIARGWLTEAATIAQARLWWDGPHPDDFGGSVPRAVAAEGGQTWAAHYLDLTEAAVAEAHALGLRVVSWTVNRAEDMRRLLQWGVDGLISDRPDLARHVLAADGYQVPLVGGPASKRLD